MRRPGYSSFVLACASVVLVATSCSEPAGPAMSQERAIARSIAAGVNGPALLTCPTNTSVSARETIGLLGGAVSAGGTTILIPPGAVLLPQEFDVTVPASRLMEVQITAVGHERFQFQLPVQVTVDYSRCRGNPATLAALSAYYIDDSTKTPLELMPGWDEKEGHRYTFVTDHLSGYAIAN